MRHWTLVHGVGVAQLWWGVACDAAQSGHQWSWGEMSREVLIGQPLHLLHGGHGAATVRRDARPGVAADVFQARHGLSGLRRAGIHARLPLARFSPVGGAAETQRLRVAHGPVVVIILAGWAFHIGLLVRVLSRVTVVLSCAQTKWDGNEFWYHFEISQAKRDWIVAISHCKKFPSSILGVALTSRLVDFKALTWALRMTSTCRWSWPIEGATG